MAHHCRRSGGKRVGFTEGEAAPPTPPPSRDSPLVMWDILAIFLRTPPIRDWVWSISWSKGVQHTAKIRKASAPGVLCAHQSSRPWAPGPPLGSQSHMPCSSSSSPTRPDMCFRTEMLPDTIGLLILAGPGSAAGWRGGNREEGREP